ncbi:MAG TPA: hypothetical protein DCQ64_18600 [Candidatus Rokubacteria bacterium]|nr:hypothetical protein [Candidatus Rokubacteria bacterium]
MLKRLLTAILTIALLAVWVPTGHAQSSFYFWAQVVDELGQPITSGVTCQVYTAGGDTASTIYGTATVNAVKANPFSASSTGVCSWYMTASTAVDLIVWHKRGRARMDAFSVNTHRVVLPQQGVTKVVRQAFTKNTSETSTFSIPKGAIVRDVFIELNGGSSNSAWIQIGTLSTEAAGDANGFCGSGVTKVGDSAGGRSLNGEATWLGCHAVVASAAAAVSSYMDFKYSAFHDGALLARGNIGQDTTVAQAHAGSYLRRAYVNNLANRTISYTTSNDNVYGHFYLIYEETSND